MAAILVTSYRGPPHIFHFWAVWYYTQLLCVFNFARWIIRAYSSGKLVRISIHIVSLRHYFAARVTMKITHSLKLSLKNGLSTSLIDDLKINFISGRVVRADSGHRHRLPCLFLNSHSKVASPWRSLLPPFPLQNSYARDGKQGKKPNPNA